MKLIIFQPKEVIERQKKFIREEYPFAQLLEVALCCISAYCIVSWYIDAASTPFKYIGIFAYLLVIILKWHYFREYDKQAEEGFKRKWGTEELNKQNVEKWFCKNTSFEDGNVTLGSLLFFSTIYTVIAAISLWIFGNTAHTILRIIYYLICGTGMIVRITFEGTHPALATIEPIDLAFGTLSIIVLHTLCLVLNQILSFKVIKCNRGKDK